MYGFALTTMPHDLSTRTGRLLAWLDMQLVDHGFIRAVYNNFHALGGGMYRLSQPSPAQIRRYQRTYGIKTIVNLRGSNGYGSYALEAQACHELGIELVDLRMYSRQPPTLALLEEARAVFERIEYPALMHCKSGADRAGLGATLYRHFRMNVPIAELRELSPRYGHFNFGATGVLDYFFARYLADAAVAPIGFMDWARTRYDKPALHADYVRQRKQGRLGDWFVDKVLRRE